jgi:dihydrofolate synthase/folylpolyglutamate synthase
MHLNPTIAEHLNRLNNLSLPGIDLSLDRMWQLLAALGNPQEKLPPVIHVAGTNGKGSTIAFLRAIYEAAGYRVHGYTSPHLVRFNERILLGGAEISDALLLDYLERIADVVMPAKAVPVVIPAKAGIQTKDASASELFLGLDSRLRGNDKNQSVNGKPINVTFFEATTALALLVFAEHPADVVLLETGLGGRLDATNVVANPLATVITPIDFDHQEFLGSSLAAIATEKAGIMKKNAACVTAIQQSPAAQVLRARANTIGAPLMLGGEAWNFSRTDDGFVVQVGDETLPLPIPNLLGAHQFANAALAAVVVGICADDLPVTNLAIAHGITQAIWPARLQQLTRGPLVDAWPPTGEVILDGGHNAHAANAIADWAKTHAPATPIYMIAAMMKRKNAVDFFAPLAPHINQLCCILMPEDPSGYTAAELATAAAEAGIEHVTESTDLPAAMAKLREAMLPKTSPTLLIAGSLHLAGEVLKNHS